MMVSVLMSIFWAALALIFYTYFLFPLLLAFFARLKGRSAPAEEIPDSRLPKVTMIVAAYNEAKVMAKKLENTWAIDYPQDRFEIVVGSDGSEDGTNEILQACADPRLNALLFKQRRGKISVLNDLVQSARTEILVMSDANTMFAPDAIRKLVRHFQDPKVGCVSGELTLEQEGGVSGEGIYWKYEGWIKRNESDLGFLIGCNGGIFALRKSLYDPLPASTIVEDFVLTMRVLEKGSRVRFEPFARATEPAAPTTRSETIRKIRIGAGDYQALGLTGALLHPRYGLCSFAYWGHKVLRWTVPFLIMAALLTNLSLIHLSLYRVLFGLQMVGLVTAGLSYGLPQGKKLPKWTRPISYFYLMNFALLRGFFRFLFQTQRVTWERAN
jgi:cellulose synthase/poly-beta-1,6-N-acetylglucosamine synthase-like glycosyltransferase